MAHVAFLASSVGSVNVPVVLRRHERAHSVGAEDTTARDTTLNLNIAV